MGHSPGQVSLVSRARVTKHRAGPRLGTHDYLWNEQREERVPQTPMPGPLSSHSKVSPGACGNAPLLVYVDWVGGGVGGL